MSEVIANDPIPDYGELMTMKEFVDCCKMGGFIDYDGWGYYATSEAINEQKTIIPSHVMKGRYDKAYSHVLWVNR